MLRFAEQAGPYFLLQVALALVVLILAAVNTVRLARGGRAPSSGLGTSIDAILFWGALIAVLGFFGQWSGLYRGATALGEYGVARPGLIILGIGESLSTSGFGLFVLIGAALLWFFLRVGLHLRQRSSRGLGS